MFVLSQVMFGKYVSKLPVYLTPYESVDGAKPAHLRITLNSKDTNIMVFAC